MSPAAVRNLAIILGVAALGVLWQRGFSESTLALQQLISLIFLALIGFAVYRYFSGNRLTWYAIPRPQRVLFVACLAGVLLLLVAGMPLLAPAIGGFGVIMLAAGLVLVMVWIVMESRRL